MGRGKESIEAAAREGMVGRRWSLYSARAINTPAQNREAAWRLAVLPPPFACVVCCLSSVCGRCVAASLAAAGVRCARALPVTVKR